MWSRTTEAKIFPTKPHAKVCSGPHGANFLRRCVREFTLKLSIADNFHNDLVKFLNSASHQNEQIKQINNHIRYIFTSYDHADYEDIMQEYDALRKSQKLSKVKPEDLNLTLPHQAERPHLRRQQRSRRSRRLVVQRVQRVQLRRLLTPKRPDPLNTSDSTDRRRWARTWNTRRRETKKTPPAAAGRDPRQWRRFVSGSVVQTVQGRVSAERLPPDGEVLDNKPITAKFDLIYEQTRRNVSKANYRTLMGIHGIPKE
ncbi:hypothetical protein quinque_002755 [Culex quinquefasciatus]